MIAIVVGFFLDMIIGEPNNPYHPIRFIGNLAIVMEKVWRKIFPKKLKLAGTVAWFLVVIITTIVSLAIVKGASLINPVFKIVVEGILIYFCISAKGLETESLKVIKTLETGDVLEARKQVSFIVGRDTTNLNKESIVRAVIETVAENMSDGIIAPLLFAGIGGAPLAFAYKAVNTCDSMFGYKNDKYIEFGFASAKLDDLFNYIPARLTGYFIVIASYILGFSYKESYKIYKRDRYNHTSPNSAHPEAAVAGALGIMLGGSNYYFGKLVKKPTIGDELTKIEIKDVYDTNKILKMVSVIGCILAISIRFIGGIIL